MEDVNRIKLVLVEKKRTNKWLSDQMGVISKLNYYISALDDLEQTLHAQITMEAKSNTKEIRTTIEDEV